MGDIGGHLSAKGAFIDTNNDGIVDGFAHTIKNAGNFNTFSLTNGVLTVQGPTGGAAIGGSSTHVQYNQGGVFKGESNFTYNESTNTLTVDNLTVTDTLIVTTTTTLNSNTVTIGDSIIVLNSDETGAPSQNAGIEIERGTSANVQLVWDETNDQWDFDTYSLASVGKVFASGSGPIYTFTSDTDTGLEHTATDQLGLVTGNTRVLMVSTNGVHIAPAGATGAGANQALLVDDIVMDTQTISTLDSNKNLILAPHGSGSVELGAVSSNATSVITTPSAHNVIGTSVSIQAGSTTAGTTNNIAGGSLTLSAGQGKGTGAGGSILFKTADGGSSGSTLNPLTTKMTILDSGFVGIAQNTPTVPLHVGGDAIISGNLTVSGTSTTVSTTNTFVTDEVLTLNSGETANGVSGGVAGFEVDRGVDGGGSDNTIARFIFDESDDKFKTQMETGSGSGSYNAAGIVASSVEGSSATITGNLVVDTNTLTVDASNNVVGLGSATVGTRLTVDGTALSNNALRVTGNATVSGNLEVYGGLTGFGQHIKIDKYMISYQNNNAATTVVGQPLRMDGSNALALPLANLAQSNSLANSAIGLVSSTAAQNNTGDLIISGILSGVAASVFTGSDPSDGDTVYVSGTAGKVTVDVPTTGFVQQVGFIQDTTVNVSGNSGSAEILVNIGHALPADVYDDDDAGVTSVTGTLPIVSTGGATPAISINAATTSAAGSMSSADKTKLDGIETSADVTDETNVKAAIDGMTLSDIGTPASADRILIQDADDSNNLKFADFSEFGGGGGTVNVVSNVATQRILGRTSAGSGDSEELTAAQTRTLLDFNNQAVGAVQTAAAIELDSSAIFIAKRSLVEDLTVNLQGTGPTAGFLMEDQRGRVLVNSIAGITTVGLPDPSASQVGDTYVFLNTHSGAVTIDRSGIGHGVAQNLNGAASNGSLPANEAVTLVYVATNAWWGIGL